MSIKARPSEKLSALAAGLFRGQQPSAGKHGLGIPRRDHTVGAGCREALVLPDGEGGVPALLNPPVTERGTYVTYDLRSPRAPGPADPETRALFRDILYHYFSPHR